MTTILQPATCPTTGRIGHMVRTLREDAGLSRTGLAEAANLSHSFISRIESGTRQAAPETLHQIARAVGQPSDQLLITAGFLPLPVTRQIETGQLQVSAVHAVLILGLLDR